MEGMQTIDEVVDRFTRSGYTDEFRAEAGGLRAVEAGCVHAPEDLRIEALERFEGASDPADEVVVLALACGHGVRGTWTLPYGSLAEAADAQWIVRLG
jgi:hypothetical protein